MEELSQGPIFEFTAQTDDQVIWYEIIANQVPPSSSLKRNQKEELPDIRLISMDEVIKFLSLFDFDQ